MLRQEYLRRLVDEAYVDIYLSAIDGARIYWPWRMQPPKEASTTYRDACESYIIDSDPLDDSVTTNEVLDTAYKLDAEVASLQDIYQDKDATVDKLLDGLAVMDDHPFGGELLLPLQEPYVECWREIGEPREHLLGIGGLKDGTASERIEASKQLRQAVGTDVWIHGFGWGVSDMANTIREMPELLDSVDYSTPMINAGQNAAPGKEVMSVAAMEAATKLVTDLRKVSPYVDTGPESYRDKDQSGLETYQ